MKLLDPFEFSEMFRGARSFAVVGNAPTILNFENGKTIDSHDVVVRFNRATTAGLESKVGSRTDILVVNASNSEKLGAPPRETLRPKCLVSFVSPQGVPRIDPVPFAEWIGEIPILLVFGPDPYGLPPAKRTRPLTSGTYLLCMLLRMLAVERLFLTGFTMFGVAAGGSGKYYSDDRPGASLYHDVDVEARVFAGLVSGFGGELTMTPEVQSLVTGAEGIRAVRKGSLRRRIADGLAWRVLRLGMRLRRIAETG